VKVLLPESTAPDCGLEIETDEVLVPEVVAVAVFE
jgi:hypothetical protein